MLWFRTLNRILHGGQKWQISNKLTPCSFNFVNAFVAVEEDSARHVEVKHINTSCLFRSLSLETAWNFMILFSI